MKSFYKTIMLFLCLSTLAYADWQCIVADKKGHRWASSGMTQERANAVALSFCTAYSPQSASCHPVNCETTQS